jgi:hypothetical protein
LWTGTDGSNAHGPIFYSVDRRYFFEFSPSVQMHYAETVLSLAAVLQLHVRVQTQRLFFLFSLPQLPPHCYTPISFLNRPLAIQTAYKNSVEPPFPAEQNAISGTGTSTISAPHPQLQRTSPIPSFTRSSSSMSYSSYRSAAASWQERLEGKLIS